MALCNAMSSESKPDRKAVPTLGGLSQPALASPPVVDRIAAFLDGATHGEDLLHELYDYVLEEPIPQRMREIFGPVSELSPGNSPKAGPGRAAAERRQPHPRS